MRPRLLPCALPLLVAGCGGSPDTGPASGKDLYRAHCAMCHGGTGEGSAIGLGPEINGTAKYWDAEKLSKYLVDPQEYARTDPRLGAREMAAIAASVTEEQRETLVEYLLERTMR